MLDAEDVIRIGRYAITVEGGESLPSVLPPSPSKRPPGMPADGTMILSAVDVRVVHRESYRPSKRTPVQTPASPPDVAAAASQTPAPAFASPWVLIGVPSFLLGVTAGTVLGWLVLGS
jgi:hypothetical protein